MGFCTCLTNRAMEDGRYSWACLHGGETNRKWAPKWAYVLADKGRPKNAFGQNC